MARHRQLGGAVRLTEQERLIIGNQLLILEKLYPEDASYYAVQRKAVEQGYTLHYSDLTSGYFDEMSEARCREVIDILQMYRCIDSNLRKPENADLQEHHMSRFNGFDGNYETSEMLYAQYFILDLDRFEELRYGSEHPDWNTHMPVLDTYRRMLDVWKPLERQWNLTHEQLESILEA